MSVIDLNTEIFSQYRNADDAALRNLSYTNPVDLQRLYNATIVMGAAAQIVNDNQLWQETHDFATRVKRQIRPLMTEEQSFQTPPSDTHTRTQNRIRRDMIRVFGTADPD